VVSSSAALDVRFVKVLPVDEELPGWTKGVKD
jgi:hypothetical protein